ncbi:MAG: sugar transporter [Planktomarina sp.]
MATPLTLPPELQGPAPAPPVRDRVIVQKAPPKSQLAPRASFKSRHHWIGASFVVTVLLPAAIVAIYLYLIALPQFASTVAFSVRDDSSSASLDLLGGLTDLSGSASKDADVLYAYLHSQQIVTEVGENVNLDAVWAVSSDPVFTLSPDATIEDMHRYWQRMIHVAYDSNAGLIQIRANAFRPDDAKHIAQAVLDQSKQLINTIADITKSDTMRLAEAEVMTATENLNTARAALSDFRTTHQILDPQADIAGRLGLLNSLQAQKAQALIDYDLLLSTQTRAGDPRLDLAQRRIEVVEGLIVKERNTWGTSAEIAYATLMSQFEALSVDVEFAQTAYVASRANFETAKADTSRTQKYLAAHITPTRAERSEYPRRLTLLSLIAGGLAVMWSIGLLLYYSIRDRR